jgi:hypothetical protein
MKTKANDVLFFRMLCRSQPLSVCRMGIQFLQKMFQCFCFSLSLFVVVVVGVVIVIVVVVIVIVIVILGREKERLFVPRPNCGQSSIRPVQYFCRRVFSAWWSRKPVHVRPYDRVCVCDACVCVCACVSDCAYLFLYVEISCHVVRVQLYLEVIFRFVPRVQEANGSSLVRCFRKNDDHGPGLPLYLRVN